MKKKLFIIIPTLFLTATLLVGCNVEFGVKSRPKNNNSVNFNNDELLGNLGTDFLDNLDNVSNNFSDFNNDNLATYDENISKTIPMKNIEDMVISIHASNVTINSVDSSDFTITCKGSSSFVNKTTIDVIGNTLNIKEHGVDSDINLGFFNKSTSREITINIPKDFNKDLKLNGGAGNMSINGISINKLNIEGGAGNLTLKDIVFQDLKLEQGVGNTTIDLSSKCGDIDIDGGVGNLSIAFAEVGGNLTYDGGVGKTVISIPNNSPVKLNTSTGVGSIDINAKTSGEDIYSFDLNVGVGNLTVN
ncbi:DUF4097 family beta strand repeat-containing protein [Clostridium sp.]|uniref:DUF4097 family beta strand repeat-containing protein n=1 Tax=Clostridium sp. TaxID=1506 RepID=UPI003216A291